MDAMPPFCDPAVAQSYARAAPDLRVGMLGLRVMIYDVAAGLPQIRGVTEVLKWGQPAFVTGRRAGTSLRVAEAKGGGYGLYVHCQTPLIADFSEAHPGLYRIDGTRGVLFDAGAPPDLGPLRGLVRAALTYHLR